MKKLISLLLVLLLCCFALTACGDSKGDAKDNASDKPATEATEEKDNPLVGTWKYEVSSLNYTYVFKADGTGTYFGESFTYTVDGNKLSILYDGNTAPFETEFSIDGDKLIIKDSFGEDTVYIRQ